LKDGLKIKWHPISRLVFRISEPVSEHHNKVWTPFKHSINYTLICPVLSVSAIWASSTIQPQYINKTFTFNGFLSVSIYDLKGLILNL
jgi:hypothetical protein